MIQLDSWRMPYVYTALLTVALAFIEADPQRCVGQVTSQTAISTVQITALLEKYAHSIDTADVILASDIWSHGGDVSFIHPLGTEIGYDKVVKDVYTKLMGTTFSKRELLLHNPSIHIYGDTAWSEFTWTFHAIVRNGGSAITTEGRETQVYHRENETWRIVHVHYSGPPLQEKPSDF